jgi:hypothetical protein
MESHIQKTINELIKVVDEREAELWKVKQTINNLLGLLEQEERYRLPDDLPVPPKDISIPAQEGPHIRKPRKNKSSKYYGVSLNKNSGKYRAEVTVKGKHHYLGEKGSEAEAARAVDDSLVEKGMPKRNFPDA